MNLNFVPYLVVQFIRNPLLWIVCGVIRIMSAEPVVPITVTDPAWGARPVTEDRIVVAETAQVSMRNAFGNGTVYYTVDGSEPNIFKTRYTTPFTISSNTLLMVRGYSPDFSRESSRNLQIDVVPKVYLLRKGAGIQVERGTNLLPTWHTGPFTSNTVVRVSTENPDTFLGWRGATNSASPIIELTLTNDLEIEAVYADATPIAEITLKHFGSGRVELSPPEPKVGDWVKIRAIPDPGHFFHSWVEVQDWQDIQFWVAKAEMTFSARFAPLPENAVSLTFDSENPVTLSEPGRLFFLKGETVTVEIKQPSWRAHFLGWGGDISGSNLTHSFVIEQNTNVRVLTSPEQFWRHAEIKTPAVGSDGTIYGLGPGPGGPSLWAFQDGVLKWYRRHLLNSPPYVVAGPEDQLYLWDAQRLVCFGPDGEVRWSKVMSLGLFHPLAVDREGTVYAGRSDGKLQKISPKGEALHEAQVAATIWAVFLAPEEGVYIDAADELVALKADLTERWKEPLPRIDRPSVRAVDEDGAVYFLRQDGKLVKMSSKQEEIWTYDNGWTMQVFPSGGRVYTQDHGTYQKGFIVLAAATGEVLQDPKWAEESKTGAVAEDGSFLIPYWHYGTTWEWPEGLALRRFTPSSNVNASTLLPSDLVHGNSLITPEGLMVIQAGGVTTVSIGMGPALKGWPMWRGDWGNRGAALDGAPASPALSVTIEHNGIRIWFRGQPGAMFELQESSDLLAWERTEVFSNELYINIPLQRNKAFFRVVQSIE